MRYRQNKEKGGLGLGAVIAIAVLAVLVSLGIWLFSYAMDVRGEGIRRETSLSAQYPANQVYLSEYTSGFYEQFGILKYKSEKLDQILQNYASGRSGEGGQSDRGGFINAVVEAVPDVSGLNVADRMFDYVQAKRQGYREYQEKLLDMLRSYDAWVSGENSVLRWLFANHVWGFPTQRLEARIGTSVWHGAEARERMYLIVNTSSTVDAYKSGTMEPLQAPSP